MTANRLTDEYVMRVERFALVFPVAHGFLRRVETEGPGHGMWLSTAVNAHLYKGQAFLAYLKLKNPGLKPPSLVISPKYNQQIVSYTTDESRLLFPQPFDDVLKAHGGLAERWAIRHAKGATEFTVAAPTAFFDDLYRALVALDVRGAGAVRQA